MKNLLAKIKEKFNAMSVQNRTKVILIGMAIFVVIILAIKC